MTTSLTDFASLSLPAHVLANLIQLGYTSMTPIQAAALPVALLGKDLIAQAKTGSGKTAAFGIALLANLNARRFAVQAMVLCPTRELADQVATEIRRLARAEENVKVVVGLESFINLFVTRLPCVPSAIEMAIDKGQPYLKLWKTIVLVRTNPIDQLPKLEVCLI